MRAVSIDNLDSGAVLGKTIFSQDGRVLLKRGAELSTKAIATLARLGYQYIYVSDDRTGDIEQPDLVSEELRAQATNTVREAFQNVADCDRTAPSGRDGIATWHTSKCLARGKNTEDYAFAWISFGCIC